MVVQELLREVVARARRPCSRAAPARIVHLGAASHVAINQGDTVLGERAKLGQDVLATSYHLGGAIGVDVRGEELRDPGLLDGRPHGLHDLRDDLVYLAKGLVALWIILDEVAALPEGAERLAVQLRLQAELRLDDGANHGAAISRATAQDVPHVNDVARRALEQTQAARRAVDVVDLAVLDVVHVLHAANGPG